MAGREGYAYFQQDVVQERALLLESMSRQAQMDQMRRSLTAGQVANATAIAQMYPTAPGAIVAPLGVMGVDPGSEAVQEIVRRADEDSFSFVDWVGQATGAAFGWVAEQADKYLADPLKAVGRTVLLGFDAAWNEVIARPYRTIVGTLQEAGIDPGVMHRLPITWDEQDFAGFSWSRLGDALGNIGQTYERAGESALIGAIRERLAGNTVNLGSGILPMSEMAEDDPEYTRLVGQGMDPEQARLQVQARLGRPLTEIANRQRETGITYQGMSVTPGRTIAGQYLDPETEPYKLMSGLIDAGINIWADPVSKGLAKNSAWRAAHRSFNGALPNGRIIGPSADKWLNSSGLRGGQQVVQHIADNLNDIPAVRRVLPEVSDRTLLADLAEYKDPAQVLSRLREQIVENRNIRKVPRANRIRNAARGVAQQTRIGKLFDEMPGRTLNIENLDEGLRTFDEFLVLGEFSHDSRVGYLNRWARLTDGDYTGAFAVYRDAMSELSADLVARLPERYRKLAAPAELSRIENVITDVFKQIDALRQYFNDIYGDPMYWPGAEVDELMRPFQTAHLMTEYLQRALPLPDPRYLRRLVSATHAEGRFLQRVLNFGAALDFEMAGRNAFEVGGILTRGVDVAVQKAWKPIVLLRLAWTSRVIGEEQGRMAVAGLDSAFRHPIQYLGWVTEQKRLGGLIGGKGGTVTVKRLNVTPGVDSVDVLGNVVPGKATYEFVDDVIDVSRGGKDVFGSIMSESKRHTAAMSQRNAGWLDIPPGDMWRGAWIPIRKHQAGFANGWVRSLGQMWDDEVTSFVLTHSLDEAYDWFETGAGQSLREQFIRSGGSEKKALLNTREGIEGYIDSVNARAHAYAGGRVTGPKTKDEWLAGVGFEIVEEGNREILDIIASGHYQGKNLRGIERPQDWKEIVDALTPLQEHLPEDFITKAPLASDLMLTRQQGMWDQFTSFGFEHLMTKPTNYLSRSPAFKQFYWKRMEELISYMDDDMADFVIKAARDAGIPRKELQKMAARRLDRAGRTAAQEGLEDITFKVRSGQKLQDVMGEADEIAKFFALKETENLLYTLSKKHAINDVLRNIFPFGEAWFEIMSTWGRLVTEKPQIIRRGQQFIEGARESGWLERDEITGEDTFNFPGASMFNRILFGEGWEDAGARVKPVGYLTGLNIAAGSYHPGLGPVIQMPSAWLLSKREEWDWLVKVANPFGVPEYESPGDLLNQNLPSWAQKLITGISGGAGATSWNSLHQSTAIDVARALSYSGQYDMNNPDDVEALQAKAKTAARAFSLLRGIIQFGAPTGPALRYEVETAGEEGQWFGYNVLADEYTQAVERFNGDETQALSWFINAYGINPLELVQSKTRSITPHHLTDPGSQWARANAAIVEDYPLTAYFISPDEVEDEFSWDAWNHALATGAREIRTVDQWRMAVNDTKGRLIYETQRKKLEDADALHSEMGRSYLRDLRNWLIDQYDGYKKEIVGEAQRPSQDDMVRELRQMVNDDRVQDYASVQALKLWFAEWDKASEVYMSMVPNGAPDGWLESNAGEPIRLYMRDFAEWILQQDQYTGFNSAYSIVFKRMLQEENVSPIDLSILGL